MSMTTKEAAEYLGVTARTVRRRAENGEWKTEYVTGKSGKELRIIIPDHVFEKKRMRKML